MPITPYNAKRGLADPAGVALFSENQMGRSANRAGNAVSKVGHDDARAAAELEPTRLIVGPLRSTFLDQSVDVTGEQIDIRHQGQGAVAFVLVITHHGVFNQLGDVERCTLRSGKVHSADGWCAVLEPVIARYRGITKRLYFRGDAAFANPEMYEFLEAEGIGYTIRLPANSVLQSRIGHLLKRPVGRPPNEVRRYFASFTYRAQSWSKPRRVVAKVEWHPGRAVPARRLHRHQPDATGRARRRLLQPAWHSGAVDQGRRDQMDPAVVPELRR